MTVRRLVIPEGSIGEDALILEGETASYIRDVLRLRPGAELTLLDGAGAEARGEITSVTKKIVALRLSERRSVSRPAGLELTLFQAVGKGDKVDAVVRQATELGVARIVPMLTERAVGEKRDRVERWRAIAEDALRVSGRPFRPMIEPVIAFDAVLERPRAPLALALLVGATLSLGDALDRCAETPNCAEILIGPEGGLSEAESFEAGKAGFLGVHLGPYVLRTETAGPAVAAMVLFWSKSIGR